MSLNKTRKREIERLKRQDYKRLDLTPFLQIQNEVFSDHEGIVNEVSPFPPFPSFRGGKVYDGVSWRE